jgi:hypothetical protein
VFAATRVHARNKAHMHRGIKNCRKLLSDLRLHMEMDTRERERNADNKAWPYKGESGFIHFRCSHAIFCMPHLYEKLAARPIGRFDALFLGPQIKGQACIHCAFITRHV